MSLVPSEETARSLNSACTRGARSPVSRLDVVVFDLDPFGVTDEAALREDIRLHGVLQPIDVTPGGVVLDGTRRARIAHEEGIECPVRVVDKPEEQWLDYRISVNVIRRRLSDLHLASLSDALVEHLGARPGRGRQRPNCVKMSEIARRLGVRPRTLERARELRDLVSSQADLGQKLRSGEITAATARRQVAARKAQARRHEEREGILRVRERCLDPHLDNREDDEPYPRLGTPFYDDGLVTVYRADCQELLPELDSSSVDAVITDPPYGLSHDDIAADDPVSADGLARCIFREAKRLLVPGGSLVCFARGGGVGIRREQWAMWLDALLPKTACLIWDKGVAGRGRPYRSCYEAILVGTQPGAQIRGCEDRSQGDVIRGMAPVSRAPGDHPASKPVALMERLVASHSYPGDLVLDPCAGSGTTLVACKRLGRRAIGIELDEKWAELAAERLEKTEPCAAALAPALDIRTSPSAGGAKGVVLRPLPRAVEVSSGAPDAA